MIVAGLCLVFTPQFARASDVALTFTGGNVSNISIDTVVGWRFTANSSLVVDSLGMYDSGGDGFITPSNVGLWEIDGDLLASATVTSADPITSGFRFTPISPVALSAGQDYVVAGTLDGDVEGDEYVASATATSIPGITWVESRAVNSSFLTFPAQFTLDNQGWFGGNFTVAVPEPSSFALLVVGLLCVGRLRRR